MAISNVKKFILKKDIYSYVLMSDDKMKKCKLNGKGQLICLLIPQDSNHPSCENQVMVNKLMDLCQIQPVQDQLRVIQIIEEQFYVDAFHNVTFSWGCDGFEKLYDLVQGAWVKLDPGCYMRIQNKTYVSPKQEIVASVGFKETALDSTGLRVMAESVKRDSLVRKIKNNLKTDLTLLRTRLGDVVQSSGVEIKRVELPNVRKQYEMAFISMIGFLVIVVFLKCILCKKIPCL